MKHAIALLLLATVAQAPPPYVVLRADAVPADDAQVRIYYDAANRPSLIAVTVARPGNYLIVLPAQPGPDPGPLPPAPDPVPGKLWGMLVLPAIPSVLEASLRTSKKVKTAFAEQRIYFSSYLANESEVQTPARQAAMAAVGGPPCVLWTNEAGKIIKATAASSESEIAADAKAIRGGH